MCFLSHLLKHGFTHKGKDNKNYKQTIIILFVFKNLHFTNLFQLILIFYYKNYFNLRNIDQIFHKILYKTQIISENKKTTHRAFTSPSINLIK